MNSHTSNSTEPDSAKFMLNATLLMPVQAITLGKGSN
jgi:hypothetical protein